MGRLLTVHPCPVCNYHVEGELHEGSSGSDVMFLRNHYALALCGQCHHLVSVLVASSQEESHTAVDDARRDMARMEADSRDGDLDARYWLPFFRAALADFTDEAPAAVSQCTVCGSADIRIVGDVTGAQYDAQDAWVECPRCKEGRLLIETTGAWN
jgi:hypothetical protein